MCSLIVCVPFVIEIIMPHSQPVSKNHDRLVGVVVKATASGVTDKGLMPGRGTNLDFKSRSNCLPPFAIYSCLS